MNANEYQVLAARTLIDRPDFTVTDEDIMIAWNAIGLAGEAGEISELIKKGIFHQHGLDKEKLYKELGDVLWYVAALCTKLDFDMGDIMQANIDKLRERYPDGYSVDASKARVDVKPNAPPTAATPLVFIEDDDIPTIYIPSAPWDLKWYAEDKSGGAWVYSRRPELWPGYWQALTGFQRACQSERVSPDWRQSLRRIVRSEEAP